MEDEKIPEAPVKKDRSDAQKQALEKAREKAQEVRAANAELRRKEAEIVKAAQAKEREAKEEQIERDYSAIQEPEEEVVIEKKPKKPKRRVVVVQDSSSSEEEIEVRLPKLKPKKSVQTAEQVAYDRSMQKMFSL